MSLRWDWGGAAVHEAEHDGRRCLRLDAGLDGPALATVADVELLDGAFEVELCVPSGRSFHGVAWRVQSEHDYESFFVRPHQVGNPDAIQYTPVFNGIPAWQLYHGCGFWNAVDFPVGRWFTIGVAFAGDAAEITIDRRRVLASRLRRPRARGRLGVLVAGEGVLLGGLTYDANTPPLAEPPEIPRVPGVVPRWSVSDPFPESALREPELGDALAGRSWTDLEAEPSGLVDLARAHGIVGDRNTVFARTVIHADRAGLRRLDLGFSDRAVVYLGGRAVYRGDDTYRSRDYRFLGSIGWYDTLYLPLEAGENELVVAVSEDFGGWGVQARLSDGR